MKQSLAEYRLIILSNEILNDHQLWINAIEDSSENISFRVVDLTASDWFEHLNKADADYFLAKPPGLTEKFKQLYDERLFILSKVLNLPVYPSFEEVLIYENKRMLSFWLKANKIPHPETHVFYRKQDAVSFVIKTTFPLVAKINIGASGKGVKILENQKEALNYIDQMFSSSGVKSRFYPKSIFSKFGKRINILFKNPYHFIERINIYSQIVANPQKDYVLFQKHIKHEFEWRVVRIGDSFFAHKKIAKDGKASGTLLKGYENPPFALLDFVKSITDKHHFYSQAVDVFEISDSEYLVNEMQCIFGQSDPYQMLVDGIPGRYIFQNDKWIFEAGDFNRNESFNLRLEYVLTKLKSVRE